MVVLSLFGEDQLVDHVEIPLWVIDLDSFRAWMDRDDFPDQGRIDFIKGKVWVDMSKEQIFTHVAVKSEFNMVVGPLVKVGRLGLYLPDGVLLSNVDADIAVKPDAVFVSHAVRKIVSACSKARRGDMSNWKARPTWCWKWLAIARFTKTCSSCATITGKPASANTG